MTLDRWLTVLKKQAEIKELLFHQGPVGELGMYGPKGNKGDKVQFKLS